jgi:hypothetical protein
MPDYPRWYRTLRAFMLGMVAGVILIPAVRSCGVEVDSTLSIWLQGGVFFGYLLLNGVFELAFGIIRHRRLGRELDRAKGVFMSDKPIIRLNRNNTPAVNGTRLTVYAIMDHYFAGWSVESLAELYGITSEESAAAVDYINSHMAALMPVYRRMLERDRQGDSPEVRARYAESHARLMALKDELDRKKREGTGDVRIAG